MSATDAKRGTKIIAVPVNLQHSTTTHTCWSPHVLRIELTWHWAFELMEAYALETSTLMPSSSTLERIINLGIMLSFTSVTCRGKTGGRVGITFSLFTAYRQWTRENFLLKK